MCENCVERFKQFNPKSHAFYGNNQLMADFVKKLADELPSMTTVMINDGLTEEEKIKAREEGKQADGVVKVAMLLGFMLGNNDHLFAHGEAVHDAIADGVMYGHTKAESEKFSSKVNN